MSHRADRGTPLRVRAPRAAVAAILLAGGLAASLAGAAPPAGAASSAGAADRVATAAVSGPATGAGHGQLLPRDSRDAAVFRGGLVYANYCVTCHGINADGNGRAARLYTPKPSN
ncbi:MAG TPA: hypothetical protein PKC20_01185, partial [Burkholderiaceae bacterium]|nr:hypothetical protein [Burkholderiaceae bacterium]